MQNNNRTLIIVVGIIIVLCGAVICIASFSILGFSIFQRGETEQVQPAPPQDILPTTAPPQSNPPEPVQPPENQTADWEPIPLPFFDDFEPPNSSWYLQNEATAITEFAQGGLRMFLDEPNYLIFTSVDVLARDVIIEVDSEKIGGPDDNSYGIVCRQDGETYYYFEVASNGYFSIGRYVDDEYTELYPWTETDAIHPGNAVNHIRARCIGERLTLFANGVALAEVHDSAIQEGYIGLMIGTFDIPGVDILFDNFNAYAP